jgi:hypothetical protein
MDISVSISAKMLKAKALTFMHSSVAIGSASQMDHTKYVEIIVTLPRKDCIDCVIEREGLPPAQLAIADCP